MSGFQEYPKWLAEFGLVVQNADEERAVIEGRAIFEELRSAEGTTKTVVGIKKGSE